LVNGFGEARSEAQRAKVGGPKGREARAVAEFLGEGSKPLHPPPNGFPAF